jgi:Rad3-related DNA helicase
MIIGLPFPQLERFVENLKKAYGAIYKYPFKPYFAPVPEAVLQRVSTKY